MAVFTTTNLLTSIQRQSFAPANQATFTSADQLSLADEVLKSTLLPALIGVREDFFTSSIDYTLIAGTGRYAIPERSVGLTIRAIHLIDSSTGNIVVELPRLSIEKLAEYSQTSASPVGYYVENNDIVVFPTPLSSIGRTLRVFYPIRPGQFIDPSAAAVIATINTGTNTITVTAIPSTWVTGNTFDLIAQRAGHSYSAIDLISTSISGTTIILPSLPSTLAVGDYITLANYSPLVQLPPDFQPALAMFTAAEMLLAMNQPMGEKMLAKGQRSLDSAIKLVSHRTVGEQELILPDWT